MCEFHAIILVLLHDSLYSKECLSLAALKVLNPIGIDQLRRLLHRCDLLK